MPAFLPYGRQVIDDADIEAVSQALRGDYLTTGPTVGRFEEAFAAATGARFAVASNSGTAALHLAAMAVGLGPGDAAVVPTVTFLATANAVRMTGAEVVFCDVDPDSGLMTTETLAAAFERARRNGLSVKAAFPVHLNGRICDMEALKAVAAPAGVVLIEDACHALGEEGAGACAHSAAACFSTHAVKAIATAEGGVTTTSDAALAARMSSLRSHGMVRDPGSFSHPDMAFSGGLPNPWYYEMPEFGWNYRLPDVLCALGLSQLQKLPQFMARRRQLARRYDEKLASLAPWLEPVPHGHANGWHLYAVLMDFGGLGTERRSVMETLRSQGIGTQVHYIPVHCQPYYENRYGALTLPGAERYYERCLSIPFYPALLDEEQDRVVEALCLLVDRGRARA